LCPTDFVIIVPEDSRRTYYAILKSGTAFTADALLLEMANPLDIVTFLTDYAPKDGRYGCGCKGSFSSCLYMPLEIN